MKYKVFNSYGAFELKSKNINLNYKDIENIIVKTPDGQEGYIKIVGSQHIYEHGYSANEDIYKFITLDYKIINIPDEVEIDGATNLLFSKIHAVENLDSAILIGKTITVNGFDGTFNYDSE